MRVRVSVAALLLTTGALVAMAGRVRGPDYELGFSGRIDLMGSRTAAHEEASSPLGITVAPFDVRAAPVGPGDRAIIFVCSCGICKTLATCLEGRKGEFRSQNLTLALAASFSPSQAEEFRGETGWSSEFLFDDGGQVAGAFAVSACPVIWLFQNGEQRRVAGPPKTAPEGDDTRTADRMVRGLWAAVSAGGGSPRPG